jgi:hypothetical protein
MQTNNQAILVVFCLLRLLREYGQVFEDRDMVALRYQLFSNVSVIIEMSLQSGKHILNLKAILPLEIKGVGQGGNDLIIGW